MGRSRILVLPLLACALTACEGRPRVELRTGAGREESRSGPAIAILDLSDGAPEAPPAGFLGLPSKGSSFEELVRQVELLEGDAHAPGVLVRLGGTRIGLGRAAEVGAMLERLGKVLPVWCHADDLGNGTMYLAARGCRRVWVSPGGTVDAVGLAAQLIYFHKLLADEIGLEVDFLQIGKYKGAEEPFTRDGPSPEARASLESTLTGIRAFWVEGIRAGRPGIGDVIEDGPYSARGAKERKLIDEVGYFDEARDALERETHAARAEVRLGPGSDSAGADLGDLIRVLAGDTMGPAPVVVVRAVGAISSDGGGLLGASGIAEQHMRSMLARLERDDDVKAVVLRIDSPGGSALASDLLWHQLMRLRAKKPLVVSVGDMAASGGYYLASAGSVIFADATSIVGSIGVVGGKVAADHALQRVGVHADTVPAKSGDPHAAARAAYESLLVPWDEATRQRVLETMTGIYDLFLARIAEGRGMPLERVAASAEGRIFGGQEGKDRGLVDEVGGLREALSRARAMAGLRPDAPVGVARESTGLLQELVQDEPQGGAPSPLSAGLGRLAPEIVPFVASLAPMVGRDSVLCSVPFALLVR
jgi:protease IV